MANLPLGSSEPTQEHADPTGSFSRAKPKPDQLKIGNQLNLFAISPLIRGSSTFGVEMGVGFQTRPAAHWWQRRRLGEVPVKAGATEGGGRRPAFTGTYASRDNRPPRRPGRLTGPGTRGRTTRFCLVLESTPNVEEPDKPLRILPIATGARRTRYRAKILCRPY